MRQSTLAVLGDDEWREVMKHATLETRIQCVQVSKWHRDEFKSDVTRGIMNDLLTSFHIHVPYTWTTQINKYGRVGYSYDVVSNIRPLGITTMDFIQFRYKRIWNYGASTGVTFKHLAQPHIMRHGTTPLPHIIQSVPGECHTMKLGAVTSAIGVYEFPTFWIGVTLRVNLIVKTINPHFTILLQGHMHFPASNFNFDFHTIYCISASIEWTRCEVWNAPARQMET